MWDMPLMWVMPLMWGRAPGYFIKAGGYQYSDIIILHDMKQYISPSQEDKMSEHASQSSFLKK